MRRSIPFTALFLIMLILTSQGLIVRPTSSSSSEDGSVKEIEQKTAVKDDLSYSYHLLNKEDIEDMKNSFGVREEDKDYNVMIDYLISH